MKTVEVDFNRRGQGGTVVVSLRRFTAPPEIGEHFLASDGEDQFEGIVSDVDMDKRRVILNMKWAQIKSIPSLYSLTSRSSSAALSGWSSNAQRILSPQSLGASLPV